VTYAEEKESRRGGIEKAAAEFYTGFSNAMKKSAKPEK
jgi:hypothetical protein